MASDAPGRGGEGENSTRACPACYADENDLAHIRFLLQQETISADQLGTAFTRARVPDVPEIRELFQQAQPKVIEVTRSL